MTSLPPNSVTRLGVATVAELLETTDGVIVVKPTSILELGTGLVLTQPVAGTAHVTATGGGVSTRKILACWAGQQLPSSVGPGLVWRVPFDADGSSFAFTLKRAFARIETPYSAGTTQFLLESAPGGQVAFAATAIATLSIAAGQYEAENTGLAVVVNSGQLLRLSFAAVGATSGYQVELEGTT